MKPINLAVIDNIDNIEEELEKEEAEFRLIAIIKKQKEIDKRLQALLSAAGE